MYSVKLNLIHKNFICGQFYRSQINHRKLKCRESNSSIRFKTIQEKPGYVHANFLGVLFTGHSRQCL